MTCTAHTGNANLLFKAQHIAWRLTAARSEQTHGFLACQIPSRQTDAADVNGYHIHGIKNKTDQPHIHKHGDVTGKMQRKYTSEKKNQREGVGQRINKIIKKLSLLNISRAGGSHKGNQLLIEILNISSVSHKQTVHACAFLCMLGSWDDLSCLFVVAAVWTETSKTQCVSLCWLSIINATLNTYMLWATVRQ